MLTEEFSRPIIFLFNESMCECVFGTFYIFHSFVLEKRCCVTGEFDVFNVPLDQLQVDKHGQGGHSRGGRVGLVVSARSGLNRV